MMGTSLTGDVSAFTNCTKLSTFNMYGSNMKLTGNISAFTNCTNLIGLVIDNNDIYGDISAIKNCTKLTHLHIKRLYNVTGDISNINYIGYALEASNTQLYGNVTVFANNTKIRRLYVNNP